MPENNDIRTKIVRERIPNAVFYIPFAYYYVVRLGTIWKLLSWILIYIMPTAFYSWLTYTGPWPLFAANYVLTLAGVFTLYELGYILNDTVAVQKERQPAIRLHNRNFRHFEKHAWIIISVRVLLAIAALAGLWAVNRTGQVTDSPHLWSVCGSVVLMTAVFGLYNSWRSKYNVWLYPILVFSRYLPFMLLYSFDGWGILMLWLSFPCVNMLERFSMPRYRYPVMRKIIPTEESKTVFRAVYYLVVIWLPLLLPVPLTVKYMYMFPLEILCFYRLMVLFYVQHHRPTNYLNG